MPKRIKAFLVHLLLSAVLAGGGLLLMLWLWYPDGVLEAVGATQVVILVVVVDLCLGPLLTLIVYNPAKVELKTDLAIIAFFQCVALIYGGWTLADGRPQWVVFHQDYFQLVRYQDMDLRQWGSVKPEYREPHWAGLGWVAAQVPLTETSDQRDQRLFDELVGGVSPAQKPELYVPLEQKRAQLLKAAQPVDKLLQFNPPSKVKSYLQEYPNVDAFVPLRSQNAVLVVLLNSQAGLVATIADLRPW